MASTIIIYKGDGAQVDFTIPFDYLAKKFVKVYLDTTELTGGDYGDTSADFFFLNPTTIRVKTAPTESQLLTIRRYTSAEDRVVSFKDASVLRASDLDVSQLQAFHIAEEGRDAVNDALSVDDNNNWNARNRRIVNVSDPIDDNDAVNYKTYKNDALGAYQSAQNAKKAEESSKEIQQDLTTKYEDFDKKYGSISEWYPDIQNKYTEITEMSTTVASNTTKVDEAVTYIEGLINIEPVKDGLACSKATWVVDEEIPEGTEITIPDGVSYVVGRKHVFVSYDGIVASPNFFNEIGAFNTVSSKISLTFPVKSGTELSVWVVPLGTIDNSLYDRVKTLEDALADLSRRVAYATDADDKA